MVVPCVSIYLTKPKREFDEEVLGGLGSSPLVQGILRKDAARYPMLWILVLGIKKRLRTIFLYFFLVCLRLIALIVFRRSTACGFLNTLSIETYALLYTI